MSDYTKVSISSFLMAVAVTVNLITISISLVLVPLIDAADSGSKMELIALPFFIAGQFAVAGLLIPFLLVAFRPAVKVGLVVVGSVTIGLAVWLSVSLFSL